VTDPPFLALCKLASAERWCWKIFCTTCGHMHFRYGFKAIALGHHPNDRDWVITNKYNPSKMLQKYGDREEVHKFDHDILARHILDVPLTAIRDSTIAPDWLGYLGLVMFHCYARGEEIRNAWATQFIEMLPRYSTAYGVMVDISEGGRDLSIKDLELVEWALYG